MHRNPSVMKHTFSEVPRAEIPRSTFDRSHGHKSAFNAGFLVPVLVDEALPGDTFNVTGTIFARLATPIFPIMDNLYLDVHYFAIPLRLVWSNWEKFNGAQDNPGDSTDYQIPQTSAPVGGYAIGNLADYFGIPTGVPSLQHSALFRRAYWLTWNLWYRDQNLQDSIPVPMGDGPDPSEDSPLLRRGKRHDYFTSCLPWPQKGPGVTIPLGGSAPIKSAANLTSDDISMVAGDGTNKVMSVSAFGSPLRFVNPAASAVNNMFADLTQASAATINSLRQAFQLQRMFERDARGGTRYTEVLKAHFGVTSPDARLQRPEFLGGGTTPVNIAPIPQTSGTGAYTPTPQGNLAAMGTVLSRNGFTMSFTEHCIILGLASVRADLTYQQGLNRMWSRKTRFDFYWPALSHIGEQAVLQKEIFASGVPAEDDTVFGYQERYGEYRYKPSVITNVMRSTAPQSLDAWHLSQDFATAPQLNAAFIEENPPIDRVVAVTDEPQFIVDMFFKMRCARPMPVYGVPGFIDHF